MLIRFLLVSFTLLVWAFGLRAQAPSDADKAYRMAARLTDPQQKMAALEKLLAEHPQGGFRLLAMRTILETLVETQPEQTGKILTQANRILAASSENSRGNWYNLIAEIFFERGILLAEAEQFAAQSVAQLGDRKNLGAAQQIAATGGRAMVMSNVPRVALLGRIYLKRGKRNEGETLIKEAYEADATQPGALLGMGELAEAKGDAKAALEYFATAYLSGRGREVARKRVVAAYYKVYPNRPNELEAWLDEKYRRDYPLPIQPQRYQPTASRTNRAVLAEVFTGAACGPCLAADLAFEAALQRYSTKELVVLMYHIPIPDVDPMMNATTEARKEFYQVRAAPYPFLNGVFLPKMGGGRSKIADSFATLTPVIDAALETPSDAQIKLHVMQQGPRIKVNAMVDKVRRASSDLRLHVVLAEDEVRYMGSNGVRFHPMVVRAMVGDRAEGWAIRAGQAARFEHTFDVQKLSALTKVYLEDYEINGRTFNPTFNEKKHEIAGHGLSLVAFVQDQKTKQVLQTVYLKLPAAVEPPK
jgi:tetratricopeptide (TPR) repeat protein